MTRRNHEFVGKFDTGRKTRKNSAYPRTGQSLEFQLLERALVVAQRKRIVFSGASANWLRELVASTADRVIAPLGAGAIAINDVLISQINKAFSAVTAVVEAIAFDVKSGITLSLTSLQDVFRKICPIVPVC
jgi:hypothetical protein